MLVSIGPFTGEGGFFLVLRGRLFFNIGSVGKTAYVFLRGVLLLLLELEAVPSSVDGLGGGGKLGRGGGTSSTFDWVNAFRGGNGGASA